MLSQEKPLIVSPNEKLGITSESLFSELEPDVALISERKMKLEEAEYDEQNSIIYLKKGAKSLSGFYFDEEGIKCREVNDNTFRMGLRVLGAYKTRDEKRFGFVVDASPIYDEETLLKLTGVSKKEMEIMLKYFQAKDYMVKLR